VGRQEVLTSRILVVDDEMIVCESCKRILEEEGYEVDIALSGKEAFEKMKANPFDIVITDLKMPGIDGMEVLRTFHKEYPDSIIIMITGFSTVETAVEAMKLGAFDYIPKPFTPDEVTIVVKKAIEKKSLMLENIYLRQELQEKYGSHNIVGKSKKMQEIYRIIAKVATTDSTVLIYGQSGTGKELIARAVHFNSPRREKQFVPVDCAVLSENLLESELFGHVRGSFTGAVTTKPGLFEVADEGTVFLDEVGNISLSIQAKLLRVLENGSFRRVGGTTDIKVDVRVISATNKDVKEEIASSRFREDLYYRLNVVPIHIPPLRERKEDIPLLIEHFLRKISSQPRKITSEAMRTLVGYPWKGNVRKLENVIERTALLTEKEEITPAELPSEILGYTDNTKEIPELTEAGIDIDAIIGDLEKRYLLKALEKSGGVKKEAAKLLNLSFRSFRHRLSKYEIR